MSRKHGQYWRSDPDKFIRDNPYEGPYGTWEEAESWAAKIRTVHADVFRVIPVEGGFGVEQDERRTLH